MPNTFVAKTSISIKAPVEKVWQALIDPVIVKQYFFGVDMKTTWEVGSNITYTGVWEGKPFEEKGKVIEVTPHGRLVSTYWSPSSGLPDLEENYQKITYELHPEGDETRLSITQENISSAENATHSEGNWNQVLEGLKKLLENHQ